MTRKSRAGASKAEEIVRERIRASLEALQPGQRIYVPPSYCVEVDGEEYKDTVSHILHTLGAVPDKDLNYYTGIDPARVPFRQEAARFEYIHFVEVDRKPKTAVYSCRNNTSRGEIGRVQWYGAWRQYCFFPAPNTAFSAGCLADIESFLKQLKEGNK